MAVLFTVYLLIVVALPLTLGLVVTYRNLSRDRLCPVCGQETLRVNSRVARMLGLVWFANSLHRRWCAVCRWEGFTRAAPPPIEVVQATPSHAAIPTRGCRTEALRTIRFAGNQWRVLLQCWQERGWHFGRLVFVGPAGRLWSDPMEPFAGATRNDVLHQALSLSDGLLTYRLREVASE